MITQPIIFVSEENTEDIEAIKTAIIQRKDKQYLLDYPTVYIHYWKNGEKEEKYSAYVGESNNIIERTKQHFDASNDREKWQSKLKENKPEIVVIGYEHFNKSLTLDVENRMIQYLLGAPNITMLFNGRGNPQHGYYPNELDQLFPIIWKKLQKQNAEVFPAEEIIKNSALFKASPFHKLTENQTEAKEIILSGSRLPGTSWKTTKTPCYCFVMCPWIAKPTTMLIGTGISMI